MRIKAWPQAVASSSPGYKTQEDVSNPEPGQSSQTETGVRNPSRKETSSQSPNERGSFPRHGAVGTPWLSPANRELIEGPCGQIKHTHEQKG